MPPPGGRHDHRLNRSRIRGHPGRGRRRRQHGLRRGRRLRLRPLGLQGRRPPPAHAPGHLQPGAPHHGRPMDRARRTRRLRGHRRTERIQRQPRQGPAHPTTRLGLARTGPRPRTRHQGRGRRGPGSARGAHRRVQRTRQGDRNPARRHHRRGGTPHRPYDRMETTRRTPQTGLAGNPQAQDRRPTRTGRPDPTMARQTAGRSPRHQHRRHVAGGRLAPGQDHRTGTDRLPGRGHPPRRTARRPPDTRPDGTRTARRRRHGTHRTHPRHMDAQQHPGRSRTPPRRHPARPHGPRRHRQPGRRTRHPPLRENNPDPLPCRTGRRRPRARQPRRTQHVRRPHTRPIHQPDDPRHGKTRHGRVRPDRPARLGSRGGHPAHPGHAGRRKPAERRPGEGRRIPAREPARGQRAHRPRRHRKDDRHARRRPSMGDPAREGIRARPDPVRPGQGRARRQHRHQRDHRRQAPRQRVRTAPGAGRRTATRIPVPARRGPPPNATGYAAPSANPTPGNRPASSTPASSSS